MLTSIGSSSCNKNPTSKKQANTAMDTMAKIRNHFLERFHAREGHYPERILADKIYRTRANLAYCKEHHIRLSGPPLGRPTKDLEPDKRRAHQDECERVEVERCFSLAKSKCGMGLITAKLQETVAHVIAMSILVLNLRRIQRVYLWIWMLLLRWLLPRRLLTIVQ